MTALARLTVLCVLVSACARAQYQEERAPRYIASEPKAPPTTPVPILKQINRHNEDGSYTYGYEAADGSFKIETKSPTGEVKGKYGYKDTDTGKLRVIEYGANKYGFQPAGEGITVAPPTLVDESTRPSKGQGGRNQYRQQQQQDDYNDYDEPAAPPPPRPQNRPQPQPQYRPAPAPQPQQQYRPAPAPQPQQQYRPAPAPQPQYRPAPAPQPQPQYRPAPAPQQQYRPAPQSAPTPPKPQFFAGAAPAPAQDSFFSPEPAQPRQYKPKQQEFRPQPQVDYQNFGSAPAQEPRFAPNSIQQPRNTQTFSMLDQLLKEYSLPPNGAAPLHDITFGSY